MLRKPSAWPMQRARQKNVRWLPGPLSSMRCIDECSNLASSGSQATQHLSWKMYDDNWVLTWLIQFRHFFHNIGLKLVKMEFLKFLHGTKRVLRITSLYRLFFISRARPLASPGNTQRICLIGIYGQFHITSGYIVQGICFVGYNNFLSKILTSNHSVCVIAMHGHFEAFWCVVMGISLVWCNWNTCSLLDPWFLLLPNFCTWSATLPFTWCLYILSCLLFELHSAEEKGEGGSDDKQDE